MRSAGNAPAGALPTEALAYAAPAARLMLLRQVPVTRRTKIVVWSGLAALSAVALVLRLVRVPISSERLRHNLVATLSDRLDSEVELADLTLMLYPKPFVVGNGLLIRHHGRRDIPPLISVK